MELCDTDFGAVMSTKNNFSGNQHKQAPSSYVLPGPGSTVHTQLSSLQEIIKAVVEITNSLGAEDAELRKELRKINKGIDHHIIAAADYVKTRGGDHVKVLAAEHRLSLIRDELERHTSVLSQTAERVTPLESRIIELETRSDKSLILRLEARIAELEKTPRPERETIEDRLSVLERKSFLSQTLEPRIVELEKAFIGPQKLDIETQITTRVLAHISDFERKLVQTRPRLESRIAELERRPPTGGGGFLQNLELKTKLSELEKKLAQDRLTPLETRIAELESSCTRKGVFQKNEALKVRVDQLEVRILERLDKLEEDMRNVKTSVESIIKRSDSFDYQFNDTFLRMSKFERVMDTTTTSSEIIKEFQIDGIGLQNLPSVYTLQDGLLNAETSISREETSTPSLKEDEMDAQSSSLSESEGSEYEAEKDQDEPRVKSKKAKDVRDLLRAACENGSLVYKVGTLKSFPLNSYDISMEHAKDFLKVTFGNYGKVRMEQFEKKLRGEPGIRVTKRKQFKNVKRVVLLARREEL